MGSREAPLRLWIDGQCLQTASAERGIGRYVTELVAGLAKFCPEVELSMSFNGAMTDRAIMARDAVAPYIPQKQIHVWFGAAQTGEAAEGLTQERLLSEAVLRHHVECLAPDVTLSASPFEGQGDPAVPYYPPEDRRVPAAGIFYDAIPYRFKAAYLPDPLHRACYERRLALHRRFDLLLGISDFATREARELNPGVTCKAIDAGPSTPLMGLLARRRGADAVELPALPFKDCRYVLFIGALDWRKNGALVVEAFHYLPADLASSLKYVIAGAYTSSDSDVVKRAWSGHGLPPENLVMLDRVSDEMLVTLYTRATVVVQPSLMEGFGLTALEANVCGAPVIAANAGALPEVIGDERALFDPRSPGELAVLIGKIVSDQDFAVSIVARSRELACKFTWQRTAELTSAALQDLVIRKRGDIAGVRYGRKRSLADIRRSTAAAVRALGVPTATKALVLAVSEPVLDHAPRLLVDSTVISLGEAGTGIQRVVRKIVQNWAPSEGQGQMIPIQPVSCARGMHLLPVSIPNPKNNDSFKIEDGPPIRFCFGDTLLMLDASWDYHSQHAVLLRKARLQGCEVIACLYDLIPLRQAAFCGPGLPEVFARGLKTQLETVSGFICISRDVADQLVTLLEAVKFPRPMKVGYFHLGADFLPDAAEGGPPATRDDDPMPAFLMVGTIEPRKGHQIALRAFEQLWHAGRKARLIIAGKAGWGTEEFGARLEGHPEFGKRLVWTKRVSDAELSGLYSSCDAVIAASYAEGFGLPLVEAAAHDKPVIASDIGVFREVAGEAGVKATFFDVGSADALAASISAFLDRQDVRTHEQHCKGRAWQTWADSAAQIRDVIYGGRWYKTYVPENVATPTQLNSLGLEAMTDAVPLDERLYGLDLVEGPSPSGDGASLKLIVKLTNLSRRPWFSRGPSGAAVPGVFVAYHVLDAAGDCIGFDNPRSAIPYVLNPGDHHFVGIDVPASWLEKGAASVDIELVQEGVEWWGSLLRAPLVGAAKMAGQ